MSSFSKRRLSYERHDTIGENAMARLGDIIDCFPGTLTVSGVTTLTGVTTIIGDLILDSTLGVDNINGYTSDAGVIINGRLPSMTEVVTSTTLTAADSGKVFFVNSDSGTADYILPVPKVGLHFKWIISANCNTATTIVTADIADTSGDDFVGGLVVQAADAKTLFLEPGANENTITLDNNLTNTAQGAGSWLEIYCGEDPNWIVIGCVNANWEAGSTGGAIFSNAG